MGNDNQPFGTIESSQEYLILLSERIGEVLDEVRRELSECKPEPAYRVQMWQVVLYTMTKLSSHIEASRRLMGDLDNLRRLLDSKYQEPAQV